jgi:phytoene/squalene synthetase
VLLALAPVLAAQPALLPHLLRMVEARAADVDNSLLADETAWLAYCDGTAGALHQAWAIVLDDEAAAQHAATIAAQARAYAMVGLVRAIPFMAQSGGAVRFSQARLQACGLENLLPSAELNGFAKQITQEAMCLVNGEPLPAALLALSGVAVIFKDYAFKLRKKEYDPYQLKSNRLGITWQIIKLNFL